MDRDGVINRAIVRGGLPYPPGSLAELEVLPMVPEALAMLKSAGFDLVVVTNQPDVARGTTTRAAVEAMHVRLKADLPLDEVLACFHDDKENCDCRKPRPGLLRLMERTRDIDLSQSFMVGDRWRDIDAGVAAGCRTVLLDYGYSEPSPRGRASHVCKTLFEAAQWIVAQVHRQQAARVGLCS